MNNINNNNLKISESLIAHYNNQILGFDPAARQLYAKWIPTNAAEQTAIVAHVKEVFKSIIAVQPVDDLDREIKCIRLGRFINGLSAVEKAHENTSFNYLELLQGVKQFLVTARKEAEEQVLLSYRAGALLSLNNQGRLSLELPRDNVTMENGLIPLNQSEEKSEEKLVGERIISIVNSQEYKSDIQTAMLQRLEELRQTAERFNYQFLQSSLKSFLLCYQQKVDLENQAARLVEKLQLAYLDFEKLDSSKAFETPHYYNALLDIDLCLTDLKSVKLPELQLKVINTLINSLEQQRQRYSDQYARKVTQHIKSQSETLKNKPSPFKQFRETFDKLINYKPTYYTLTVDKNNLLHYPITSTVVPFNGNSIQAIIKNQVDSLLKSFEGSKFPKKDLLMLGKEISQALTLVEKDYANYKEFNIFLSSLRQTLDEFLVCQTQLLEKQIQELSIDNKTTAYQMLALESPNYPADVMIRIFSYHYGFALTEHLFSKYIPEKQNSLSYDEVRDLLFAVAADVRSSDLRWKYEQRPLKNEKSFDTLSQEELNNLLNSFRKGPAGQNLLDCFNIPLTWDKHCVTDEFLKTLPANSIEACNRSNAIQVLADLESSHMWHGKRSIRMSQSQMYENLARIFQDPLKADLFHSDYYLSFLTIASTFFALLQDCKGNPDLVQARSPALIARIDQILKNPPKEYQNKHFESYKAQWNTLRHSLQTAVENPAINPTVLFSEFLVHPLAKNKKETLSIHEQVRPTEYLARKVGYWNKYFLENPAIYKQYPVRKNQALRVGTLFHHQEASGVVLYEVKQCTIKGGLVCQVCAPLNTRPYKEKGLPIPIKMIFQGTIIQNASYSRDYAAAKPGHRDWAEKGAALFSGQLSQALINEIEQHGKATKFHIEITGHSLGGSDTQNAAAELGKLLLADRILADHIHQVKVVTFNRAGVPISTIDKFNQAFKYKHHNKLDSIIHAVVKDDIVQVSGEASLGHMLGAPDKCFHLEKNSTKGNGEMDLHCDIAHGNTATQLGTIYPIRLLDPVADADAIERYLTTFAGSGKAFTGHLINLVNRNPVVQGAATLAASSALITTGIALNATSGMLSGNRSRKKKEDDDEDDTAQSSAGTALIYAGIATAGAGLTKAAKQYSDGTQILEGND